MPETALNFNHNQPVYTVSEVSFSIKRVVEDKFGTVRIRGEISGFKQAASGHVYFRLKDDNAVIDGVMWRGIAGKLAFKAEDGLEVVCTGKVTTYPGRSSYQIVVDHMEPAGVGALMALLENRRKALEAEGLFDPGRKKPLPYLPRVVGVITSPTGAVIRDILHRLSERFPLHVIVWPVAVQGEAAAEQIAGAICGFNALPMTPPERSAERSMGHGSGLARPTGLAASGLVPRPDLLIVARGGGSIEDLWAFNEEIVVRTAAASAIPLISAVGHETDTTLIDYVSDRRAPTPTAAAEMAAPVLSELRLGVTQLEARLHAAAQRLLSQRQDMLTSLSRGLPRPAQLLQTAAQRLDDWSERLHAALPACLQRKEQQLALLSAGLRPQALLSDIRKTQERLHELRQRLHHAWHRMHAGREEKLEGLLRLLESVNYQRVLERGFAIVRDGGGHVVASRTQAAQASGLTLTFKDGMINIIAD